jgi:hypothetical protein
MEKDWGKGFPSAYVWLQCNHFDKSGVSLLASIAKVPWITGAFRGFIIGLLIEEKMYRFATYSGAKLEYLNIDNQMVEFVVSDKQYKLLVRAYRRNGVILHAPYDMQFIQRASESLTSEVDVTFWIKNNKTERNIFSGRGYPTGLDVNGKLSEIASTV